jgi:hypothetical protein
MRAGEIFDPLLDFSELSLIFDFSRLSDKMDFRDFELELMDVDGS